MQWPIENKSVFWTTAKLNLLLAIALFSHRTRCTVNQCSSMRGMVVLVNDAGGCTCVYERKRQIINLAVVHGHS